MTAQTSTPAVSQTFMAAQENLAKVFPGYQRRPPQEQMAAFVESLFADGSDDKPVQGFAQAGTGTGKSYAHMIPATLAAVHENKRTIVAATTITLLDQLVRDARTITEHIAPEAKIEVLKGRSRYVCLSNLSLANPGDVANLEALRAEVALRPVSTDSEGVEKEEPEHTGDRSDLATPVSNQEWPLVSTTSDDCLKSKCAFHLECFAERAKKRADLADVVLTSTTTLVLDAAMRRQAQETFPNASGPLLGDYDALIIDEAHAAPEVARDMLGFDLRQGGLHSYGEQVTSYVSLHTGRGEETGEDADKTAASFAASMKAVEECEKLAARLDGHSEALALIFNQTFENPDEKLRADNVDVDTVFVTDHIDLLMDMYQAVESLHKHAKNTEPRRGDKDKQKTRHEKLLREGENFLDKVRGVMLAADDGNVCWAERYKTKGAQPWQICARPIDIAPFMAQEFWEKVPASVLVSATLATGGDDFTYISNTLGIREPRTLNVGTPFDYPNQAMVYVAPQEAPLPQGKEREEWTTWSQAATLELVREAGGGALLLFTARKDMVAAYEALGPRLRADGHTVLLQGGDESNKELARRFMEDVDSVLFGTESFMTGADFPGEACRLVVLSKFPFPALRPVLKARASKIDKERGEGKSFSLLSLPLMEMLLHQVFGRLIRTKECYGVVAILDARGSRQRPFYGRRVIAGLPPAPATTSMDDVRTFYKGWRKARSAA